MRGLLLAASAVLLAAGCSSSSSRPAAPTIGAARTYHLAGFSPTAPVRPGKPVVVAFTIDQPSGAALVDYKRGSGPHTGVHVIIVRDDLGTIVHRHPPVDANGRASERITFPQPGPYRVARLACDGLVPVRAFELDLAVHPGDREHRHPAVVAFEGPVGLELAQHVSDLLRCGHLALRATLCGTALASGRGAFSHRIRAARPH